MVESTYEELTRIGFSPTSNATTPRDFPTTLVYEERDKKGIRLFILMEHETKNIYTVHAMRDSNYQGYSVCREQDQKLVESITSIDDLFEFLRNPKPRLVA